MADERRVCCRVRVREKRERGERGGTDGNRGRGWTIAEVCDTVANVADNGRAAGSTLSGGEQQMLAVGRALVSDARTLLLDEPTEGLAPYIVERVVETIEALRNRGMTVLLVEQNVRVALDVCDYVYVMDNGRIVHRSSADELRGSEVLDRYLGVSLDGSED